MRNRPQPRCRRSDEDGYLLVGLLFGVAMILVALSVAMPKVRVEIQRDQELETMNRGRQYSRAIQLYYRKFHSYPTSVDALTSTNMMRFLRKKYDDPITGKADWQPIGVGMNKAPILLGFFGQPLEVGGAVVMGLGPGIAAANGNGQTNAANAGLSGPSFGQPSGPTFGGGGIMGFSPGSGKPSIAVYKTMTHYDEWEFVYSPLADISIRGYVPVAPTQPPTNAGSPGFNGGPGKK